MRLLMKEHQQKSFWSFYANVKFFRKKPELVSAYTRYKRMNVIMRTAKSKIMVARITLKGRRLDPFYPLQTTS